MSQFFILKPAIDTSETGNAFPAVESFDDYNFNGPNSVYKLNKNIIPDVIPDIRFKIAKRAKITDVLSQATINNSGLLISLNFKELLVDFRLDKHTFYPASIYKNSEHLKYFWMHLNWIPNFELINFKSSNFKYKISRTEYIECQFPDKNKYLSKKKELGFFNPIIPKELHVLNIEFDLFTHPLRPAVCISQKFRESILENQISGCAFEELSWINSIKK